MSPRTSGPLEAKIWVPKRSGERLDQLQDLVSDITGASTEIACKTGTRVELQTTAPSLDECSTLESRIASEFPDHEKRVEMADGRFILEISARPPDPDAVLSADQVDALTDNQ